MVQKARGKGNEKTNAPIYVRSLDKLRANHNESKQCKQKLKSRGK